jgi:ribonuclease BN (tRNA processing enzyme)
MLPEIGVLFDAGTGIFRARDLIETPTLDIFLSHVHLDHCIGLSFLFDVLHDKTMQRVTVHAEDRKCQAIETHLFAKDLFPVRPDFELKPINAGGSVELSDGSRLTAFSLKHPGGSLGFRVDWPDRSMAYVTDTTADANADYVKHIHGVQTLIHECYFPDGHEDLAARTGHSCLTPVAKVAAAAEVKRLHLVHVNPLDESELPFDLDSVRSIYDRAEIPRDGDTTEV